MIKLYFTPIVIEQTRQGERSYDIYSRLLKDRIILIFGEINDAMSSSIIAQLLFLDSISNDDIHLYINSPGGSITAGMAIFDTMNFIKSDVETICIGMAASMASFLLASGTKGKRYSLENSEIMIHQPLGGFEGQATDIDIHAKRILRIKDKMNSILASLTNQEKSVINHDTERDYFMFPEEAKEYGIIDGILQKGFLNTLNK